MTGTHILLDLFGCQPLETEQWRSLLRCAIDAARVELITLELREFQPQGLTAFCLLSESHLSVHTWPEHDFVGIDLFTCGARCQPESAIDVLLGTLKPTESNIRRLGRGSVSSKIDRTLESVPPKSQEGSTSG